MEAIVAKITFYKKHLEKAFDFKKILRKLANVLRKLANESWDFCQEQRDTVGGYRYADPDEDFFVWRDKTVTALVQLKK